MAHILFYVGLGAFALISLASFTGSGSDKTGMALVPLGFFAASIAAHVLGM